jgi:hypothetical protein
MEEMLAEEDSGKFFRRFLSFSTLPGRCSALVRLLRLEQFVKLDAFLDDEYPLLLQSTKGLGRTRCAKHGSNHTHLIDIDVS